MGRLEVNEFTTGKIKSAEKFNSFQIGLSLLVGVGQFCFLCFWYICILWGSVLQWPKGIDLGLY